MCDKCGWITPTTRQIWIMVSLYLTMMGNGMALGVTGAMTVALQSPDSIIHLDLASASWLNSVMGLGMMSMCLWTWTITVPFGRRGAFLISLSLGIISSIITYFTKDIKILIIARFLEGGCMGLTSLVGAIIIGEYSTPEYRGMFLNLKCAMQFVGGLIAHVMEQYMDWRTISLTIAVPYFINVITIYTWPESPSWLASQKLYEESKASFYWLRGITEETTKELNAMIASQKQLDFYKTKPLKEKVVFVLKKFKQKNLLKPLGIYLFAAILLDTSGRHLYPAYALQIIQEMDKDISNTHFYSICLDLLMSVSCISSIVLVKILKRRTLLFSSGAASVTVLLAVSLYYYLQSKLLIPENWNTLCLVLFGSYFVFVNLGCTPITLTLIGELFPLEHRSIGSSISGCLIGLFMLFTLKLTPLMLVSMKVYGTFAAYGVSMGICLLVLYLYLPETKNKSLPEIERYFNDNFNDNNRNDEEGQNLSPDRSNK